MTTNELQGKKYKIIEYKYKNVFLVENVFDAKMCAQLINDIKTINCKKLVFDKGNNVECFKVISNENSQTNQIVRQKIMEIINDMIFLKDITISSINEIEIRKVYGETRVHSYGTCTDSVQHPTRNHFIKTARSLTIVGVLNDDYDGGEYHFPTQDLTIKLKAGSFIVFPPYWTHPHSVSKIVTRPNSNEYRYILSTWGLDNFFIKHDEDDNVNNIIVI